MAGVPKNQLWIVITSYSIHYTKLYEDLEERAAVFALQVEPGVLFALAVARDDERNNFV